MLRAWLTQQVTKGRDSGGWGSCGGCSDCFHDLDPEQKQRQEPPWVQGRLGKQVGWGQGHQQVVGRFTGTVCYPRMVVAPAIHDRRHHGEAGDRIGGQWQECGALTGSSGDSTPVLPTFNSCHFQQGFSLSSPTNQGRGGAQSGEQDTGSQAPRGLSTTDVQSERHLLSAPCPGQLSPSTDTG